MVKPVRFTPEMIADYVGKGYWDNTTTLADLWDMNSQRHPHKEALVDGKSRLSWGQIKEQTDRMALGLLELGLKRDQVVVIQLPNWVELFTCRLACEKAGILNLPVVRNLRQAELRQVLDRVSAVGVIIPWRYEGRDYFRMIQEIGPELAELRHIFVVGQEVPQGAISVAEMAQSPLEKKYPADHLRATRIRADEVVYLSLTSGTTGVPKIAENPTYSAVCSARRYAERLPLTPEDIIAILSPVIGGLGRSLVMGAAPLVGCKVVLLDRFDVEETFRLIERERPTFLGMVPAQLSLIMSHPDLNKYDLSSLRYLLCGTAMLSPGLAQAAEEKLGCPISNLYGGMDLGSGCATAFDDPQWVRLATVGRPFNGNEVRLVDEEGREVPPGEVGTVLIRGPSCISGYFRDPEATADTWRDGWFNMGDLGRFDERGNLRLVGRGKDVINRGGTKVYPVEVENLLMTHPRVAQAALVAMPDPVLGEKACAYVVLKGGGGLDLQETVSFLREKQIASYKLPERLEIVDRLPMASDQKVDKKALREDIAGKLRAEGSV